MEASEKLDITPVESVRAIDDRLVIEKLVVEDGRSARVVRERAEAGHSPARTVTDAIEIGSRVLDREDIAADVDYVRSEFERAAAELSTGFGDQARAVTEALQKGLDQVFDSDAGLMARTLEGHSEEIGEQIAHHFGQERSTAVQHQIKETVSKLVEERLQGLVRHFASDDAANPFADVKRGIIQAVGESTRRQEQRVQALAESLQRVETEIVRIAEQAGAKRELAEAEEAGTRKGRSFEERVHAAIERIAVARGDAAFHVGDEPGKGGSKKGDTVVEIDGATGTGVARIVFEAKDKKLSKKSAWDELNGAMAEREADFGILVVAGEDHIPSGREQLHEYEGNKVIVAVDAEDPEGLGLELAYRYARCRLILKLEGDMEMDAPAVRDAASEALSALRQGQSIKLALKKAETGVDEARTGLEQMAAEVRLRLERIESLASG